MFLCARWTGARGKLERLLGHGGLAYKSPSTLTALGRGPAHSHDQSSGRSLLGICYVHLHPTISNKLAALRKRHRNSTLSGVAHEFAA